jgi:outer membrane lipoprotein-sorting protein
MRRLRTASTRHLLAFVAAVVVLAAGAAVARAALDGASAPPAKPLDRAVYDAVSAPDVAGITARIHFTNDLLPSGSLPEGSTSPLISGADGRLWLGNDGQLRLELQSDSGDAQIVSDGHGFMVYDATSNTAYTGTLSEEQPQKQQADQKPTLAGVDKALAHLEQMWTLSGAQPGTTADRPSYTVRISPKDDGGLLGAAELAWDSAHGVPLRAAVYAQGQTTPVLELKATHVAYGSLPASTFTTKAPAGAKVTQISQAAPPAAGMHSSPSDVTGAAAVAKAVDFPLAAPKTLAGLPLKQVRLVKSHDGTGAISTYGQGLGAIIVLQSKAGKGGENPLSQLRLPRIAIGNATGSELATALGTVLIFQRAGVSYVVAGSVPPLAAENAARGLR